jgi:hypothetical protein
LGTFQDRYKYPFNQTCIQEATGVSLELPAAREEVNTQMKTIVILAVVGIVAFVGIAGAAVASEPVADALGLEGLHEWAHQHAWSWSGEGADMPHNYDYNYSYDYDCETCPCDCNSTSTA